MLTYDPVMPGGPQGEARFYPITASLATLVAAAIAIAAAAAALEGVPVDELTFLPSGKR
jgi:hypothetical protein